MKAIRRQALSGQTPTSLIDFLARDDGAAGLLPAAQRILELRQDVLALMPASLMAACEVSGFDDSVVLLRVSTAGAAAKLRQTLPRLREGLLERGWKVSAIRMRVQPRRSLEGSAAGTVPSDAAIPRAGVEAFADLNRLLEQSELKTAVERLLRRRLV